MKIKSWEDVDAALDEIGEQEALIAMAKATVDDAKEQIKTIAPHIEQWVREHEEDLQERSRALPNGRVWLRKATRLALVGKASWKKVLALLLEGKRYSLIHVERSVDKEALKELPDERLAELKIKRDTTDAFGYETA